MLSRENETCSVLCRKSSPPPLLAEDEDDDEQGWVGQVDQWGPRDEEEEGQGGEGGVDEQMPDAGSLTDKEYRESVRRRMKVQRTGTLACMARN